MYSFIITPDIWRKFEKGLLIGMFKIQLIILHTMIVDYRFFVEGLKW